MENSELKVVAQGSLHMGKMVQLDQAQMTYRASIPQGIEISEVLHPAFWKHYAKLLKPNDLINALWEDGTQEADIRVRYVEKTEVSVILRCHYKYAEEAANLVLETDNHAVKWKGPNSLWCVVLKANGDVIKDKLATKFQASNYLKSHIGTVTL